MYVQKQTDWLEVEDCKNLKRASSLARDLRKPLNTLVTFNPYQGSLPTPKARAEDLNRLITYLRTWLRRHAGLALHAIWVWHSDRNGRNPHVHVFLHCPKKLRENLSKALDGVYPEPRVIDVREGSDIRKLHHSGFWSSTPDYLMRFQSQQAWWGGGKKNNRMTYRGEDGKRHGIKSPLVGRRWGCTRNLNHNAVAAYWEARKRPKAA